MDYKKYLIEGFCPVDKYHCLMPVEYESYEEDGAVAGYHKKRMVCRHALAGSCENEGECKFLRTHQRHLAKMRSGMSSNVKLMICCADCEDIIIPQTYLHYAALAAVWMAIKILNVSKRH